ncbi:MAG TPA: hypothetical protein V6D09_05830 [Leptolyngbyaceae cyanobacterium]
MLRKKSILDAILTPRSLSPPYEYIEDGDFRDWLNSAKWKCDRAIN